MTIGRDVLLARSRARLLDRLASAGQYGSEVAEQTRSALDGYDDDLRKIFESDHVDGTNWQETPLPPTPSLSDRHARAYRSKDLESAMHTILQIARDATDAILQIFDVGSINDEAEPKDEP